jgi:ubiquinone/menaquinone biosynthesis C-methylase UbiE
MTSTDAAFAGSIPAIYERYLVPMLFAPFARDLASRVGALGPCRILETAAGTGVVTAEMARAVPEAEIVATDLNQAMLDVAAERLGAASVTLQAADAQALPFEDSSFDAIVCQFGVMFFPDRIGAYREARRVLRPGGTFLFNAWNSLERNPGSLAVAQAVADLFPDDPPSFLSRVPFGYHDKARIEADLRAAGFTRIASETVEQRGVLGSAQAAATGLCHGTPLRAEIEARDAARLDEATAAAAAAIEKLYGSAGGEAAMSAHVFSARI